jgi:serine/threonine protein kinase
MKTEGRRFSLAIQAPEALAGKVTDKGDVYALGVIINECLTCEEPFKEYGSPYQVRLQDYS